MNGETYNTLTALLLGTALLALIVSVFSLAAVAWRWRAATRGRHLRRFLGSLFAAVALVATHQAMLWWVFLPSLGRKQMAEYEAARNERVEASTRLRVGDQVPSRLGAAHANRRCPTWRRFGGNTKSSPTFACW